MRVYEAVASVVDPGGGRWRAIRSSGFGPRLVRWRTPQEASSSGFGLGREYWLLLLLWEEGEVEEEHLEVCLEAPSAPSSVATADKLVSSVS